MTEVFNQQVVEDQKVCSVHGEYTYKRYMSNGVLVGSSRCPECAKEAQKQEEMRQQKSRADMLKAQRSERHAKSKIPKRFKESRFDNYVVEHDGQQRALAICKNYALSWNAIKKIGTGLIFSGKAGAGKTHLACSIAYEVIEQGGAAYFATVAEVMRTIKSSFSKDAETTEQEQIDHFSNIELLILDEVGMDYGTDFNKALIFEILNNRYENMLPTLLLTNLDASALREYLGERLIDRMREGGGKLIAFTWESHRGKE
jgi:DNA replication protein DnaC